jgi:hypothetical protein
LHTLTHSKQAVLRIPSVAGLAVQKYANKALHQLLIGVRLNIIYMLQE